MYADKVCLEVDVTEAFELDAYWKEFLNRSLLLRLVIGFYCCR